MKALFVILTSTTLVTLAVQQDDVVFRINKCCPENQQLARRKLRECVPFHLGQHHYHHKDDNETLKYAPWWFPEGVDILSADDTPLSSFPKNAQVDSCRQPCDVSLTASYPTLYLNFSFYENGSIYILEDPDYNIDHVGHILFPPKSFCIDRLEDEDIGNSSNIVISSEYFLLLCPCTFVPCVQKCCWPGMILDVDTGDGGTLNAHCKKDHSRVYPEERYSWFPDSNTSMYVIYDYPKCKMNEEIVFPNLVRETDKEGFTINADGTAQITGETYIIDKYGYCVEEITSPETATRSQHILRCSPKEGLRERELKGTRILYGSLFSIGAFFLLLTLVIYMLLPNRKTTNEKNLISQTWSLFIGYVGLAIGQLAIAYLPHPLCMLLGFTVQYSFLAAFFWLNVLCFDISWTFSDLKPLSGNNLVRDRKFIYYSLYGWGCPSIIVLVTAIIEFLPNSPSHILKPEFKESCWFRNDSYAKLAYFYGPIAVLLIINIILFIFTSYKIMKAQRDTAAMLNKTNDNQRLVLYFKLFLLMGLSWITELLSWVIGGPYYYWYATDIVNLLRAVFIFVVLCCKKKVVNDLRSRFNLKPSNSRRSGNNRVNSMTLATNITSSFPARPSNNNTTQV